MVNEKMALWVLYTLQEFSADDIDTMTKALKVKLSEVTDGND